jgi:type II secretory pathway pseudopilin PulG
MFILANAKTKAARGHMKEAFKNEEGAIDLASIMVGIIVIGLIGGVIAATVFAVIPWAQDNAAKQQLDAVVTAQNSYIGLSTEGGTAASFGGAKISPNVTNPAVFGLSGSSRQTIGNDLNKDGAGSGTGVAATLLTTDSTKLVIGWYDTGANAHYAAAIKSATGEIFYVTDVKTKPTLRVAESIPAYSAIVIQQARLGS